MTEIEQLNQHLASFILRQEIQSRAICEVLRIVVRPDASRSSEFCGQMRMQVDELLSGFADHPNAGAEALATLQLAAMLEAAGEPPPHD